MKHVAVIGAGIVGLSVAHHLLNSGARVTLIDSAPEGDKASNGNAAGIAVTEVIPASVPGLFRQIPGWLIDPLGPLSLRPAYAPKLIPWLLRFSKAGSEAELLRLSAALASINNRVYDDLLPLLKQNQLSGELHRTGALTVYERASAFEQDARYWEIKRSHGVDLVYLSGSEVRAMEPALSNVVRQGVFAPQWSQVNDPKRLVDQLRLSLVQRGMQIQVGKVQEVHPTIGSSSVTMDLDGGKTFAADKVVIACGAWSGILAKRIGDKVLLESERGYNTTISNPRVQLAREVIFAERQFVATPLSCGLRVGGAAEFGGLNAVANYKRSEALAKLAKMYLPELQTSGGVHWAGHRPATPDSIPVISHSAFTPHVVYAFGHGHLGLTQAATTGRLVDDMIFNRAPVIDLSPFAISRFN